MQKDDADDTEMCAHERRPGSSRETPVYTVRETKSAGGVGGRSNVKLSILPAALCINLVIKSSAMYNNASFKP